jgi:threonine/homoserine/homoserine lactone efflux protein
MPVETWLLFIAIAFLPALSPGPAILLAISNSIRFGAKATVYSGLGNAVGLLLLGFAVAFGLAAIMVASALAFTIVKLAGALYLFYLGTKLWRDGKAFSIQPAQPAVMKSRLGLFFEALAVALTNPKGIILLAALLPPFVDHTQPVFPQVAVMSATFASLCFGNHLFLAFAGARVRHFLSSPCRLKAVRRALGSLFIGFGAALAFASR